MAHQFRISEESLADDFRWIDEVTPEDACWILASVQDAFGSQLFDDFIQPEIASRISTVAGLTAEIQSRLRRVLR